MAYCGRYTIVKWGEDRFSAHPLSCKCWSCERCAKWRAALLVKEASAGKPRLFLTLTSNPETGGSTSLRARRLIIAWRQVLRRLKTHPRYKRLQYFVVMEATKRGEPHLHILIRAPFISQTWLSNQMRELIGAPIVHIEQIKSKRKIANYVAKYVGKAPHQFEGCKRYWRSLNYMHPTRAELRAQRDPNLTYHLAPVPFGEYAELCRQAGCPIDGAWLSMLKARLAPGSAAPPRVQTPFAQEGSGGCGPPSPSHEGANCA